MTHDPRNTSFSTPIDFSKYDESKHPRDKDGKWTTKSGGTSKQGTSTTDTKKDRGRPEAKKAEDLNVEGLESMTPRAKRAADARNEAADKKAAEERARTETIREVKPTGPESIVGKQFDVPYEPNPYMPGYIAGPSTVKGYDEATNEYIVENSLGHTNRHPAAEVQKDVAAREKRMAEAKRRSEEAKAKYAEGGIEALLGPSGEPIPGSTVETVKPGEAGSFGPSPGQKKSAGEAEARAARVEGDIHLQGVGKVDAISYGNVKAGDRLMYNYGYVSTVKSIEPVGKASVRVTEIGPEGKETVSTRRRTKKIGFPSDQGGGGTSSDAPAPISERVRDYDAYIEQRSNRKQRMMEYGSVGGERPKRAADREKARRANESPERKRMREEAEGTPR